MRSRLILLGGQTISLGLMMAFLVVPASSVFLAVYGATVLPYTYLCVAVAGVAVSAMMTRAQRRWSLAVVAVMVLAAYAVMVSAAWAALQFADATWVTFPLVVLFPLSIPVGFVLVGTQAGRLLDVRQMKAYFPRVVAGFSVGFALGGLAAARLVGLFGGPANLLAIDAVVAIAFLVLVVITARAHPAELATRPAPPQAPDPRVRQEPSPGIRVLLRNRLVVLIFGYQLLSAAVTQLLDFMVWERAAARYPDPSDLARFLGVYGAIINIVSIAFVALLAGRLLSRYGIRLGLAANPAGVLLLLVIGAGAGYAGGAASTVFFLVVCAQQITDIALTDGTTRTSVNATYQALPASQRVAAQTWVEGVGFPIALGLVGLLLIAGNALDMSIVTLVVVTAGLTVVWLVLAFAAFTEYGTNLRRTLTRRDWDPVALRLDDDSRAAVDRLVDGDDIAGLVLGLDLLADTDDPALVPRLRGLLADPDPERRRVAVSVAARSVHRSADSSWVPDALRPLLEDPDEEVRAAAAIALADFGTDEDRESARRAWAAALLGADPVAQRTALAAAAAGPDARYAPALMTLAAGATTPQGLADALAANAGSLVPSIDALLSSGDSLSALSVRRLVSALGEAGTPEARAMLVAHLDHPDLDTSDAVLDALLAGGPVSAEQRPPVRAALDGDAQRLAEVLAAAEAIGDGPPAAHVRRALLDEASRSRARAMGLLGLLHDPTSLARTVGMLEEENGNRPLALETLEVTVGRSAFPLALALLDPSLEDSDRRVQLRALGFTTDDRATDDVLIDLIDDPRRFWRDAWLRACALHMLAGLDPERAGREAAGHLAATDPVTAETAEWVVRSTKVLP